MPVRPSCLAVLALVLAARAADLAAAEPPAAWLGAYTEVRRELPAPIAEHGDYPAGLELVLLVPTGSAERAGLAAGDVLLALDGLAFGAGDADPGAQLRERLRDRRAGETVRLTLLRRSPRLLLDRDGVLVGEAAARDVAWALPEALSELAASGGRLRLDADASPRLLELDVTLVARPKHSLPVRRVPPVGSLHPEILAATPSLARWAAPIVTAAGWDDDVADLEARLRRMSESDDGFRLDAVRFVHRHPWHVAELAERLSHALAPPGGRAALADRVAAAAALDRIGVSVPDEGLPRVRTAAELADVLEALLAEVVALRNEALAPLDAGDRAAIAAHLPSLAESLGAHVYLHADEDPVRRAAHFRCLELAARVRRDGLLRAAVAWARLGDPAWLRSVQRTLVAGDGADEEWLLRRETPHGEIVIGGTGANRYRSMTPAVIVDLGGDDLYSDGAGAARWDALPVTAVLDLAGDDSHVSTEPVAQGAAAGGVALLVDLEGDDRYLATTWSQGTGVLGVGMLLDVAGDDEYHARSLSQGTGLWGSGILVDLAGADLYDGRVFVQGVGLPGGVGLLHDAAGDDRHRATGGTPTGYGTPGVYDAWSQGCGVGFRDVQSGGLGALVDDGGDDRRLAGNFSQGGGYYFGWGLLHDRGRGRDRYVGSRYDQGFSAHQAVGTFFEDGGDDTYVTENAVIAGLAWDESVTLFRERAGDDVYRAGGFSLGASAHNSFSFFVDEGGSDRYEGTDRGRSGPNDYHGGTSLSVVLDLGGGRDEARDGLIRPGLLLRGAHGFVLDRRGRLDRGLDEVTARELVEASVPP